MAKIPPKTIEQHLDDIYPQIWEEYISGAENGWVDYDEHPWSRYMEKSQRLSEGWHYVKISSAHKDVTVIYWLKSQKAKFKYSKREFLIEDSQIAMMVALKWT